MKDLIQQAYLGFLKLEQAGKVEVTYGYGPNQQHIHDNYHDHIKRCAGNRIRFNIQTFDSPDGDIWCEGEALVNGTDIVEILKMQEYSQ